MVRQFLHSKPFFSKTAPAMRIFKKMKAFAKFRFEICCIYLAYVSNLARRTIDVKLLLVSHHLCDRSVDAKRIKKRFRQNGSCFSTTLTKKSRSKKNWVDKEKKLLNSSVNLRSRRILIYHTMSETKAAFAERTISSPKNVVYRYM